jgi:hypothetical protein
VQTSTNLAAWSDVARSLGGAATSAINSSGFLVNDSGQNVRLVTVTAPAATEQKRFLRLQIARF